MGVFYQNKNFLIKTVLLVSVAYSFFYAFFGIDMTDACLHFYVQRNSFQGVGDVWMSVPLTNYLGGWWLSISPIRNRILWANFGGALLYVANMYFATKIYLEIFDRTGWKDLLMILGIVLGISTKDTISYYLFPVTLSIIFFYEMLLCVKRENSGKRFFGLGCLGGVIFFSRFTFCTILLFPAAYFLYRHLYLNERIRRNFFLYAAGIAFSAIVLFPLFYFWKSQFALGASELTVANILYRIKCSCFILLKLYWLLPVACAYILIVGLVEYYFSVGKQKIIGFCTMGGAVLISALLLSYYSVQPREWRLYYGPLPHEKIALTIIPALLLVMLFIAWGDRKMTSTTLNKTVEIPYITAICLFSIIIPLGSDVAGTKLAYMAPVYLMILGGCLLHRTDPQHHFRYYVFYAFLLGSILIRPLYTYLDAPVLQCKASPCRPELNLLRTTEQRAKDWDQLLNVLQKKTENEHEVLMVGYINFGPLFLLDLNDWNHGVCTAGNDFMKRYGRNLKQKALPKIAVVDECSREYQSFKDILQKIYHPVYCLKRKCFCYSIWEKND